MTSIASSYSSRTRIAAVSPPGRVARRIPFILTLLTLVFLLTAPAAVAQDAAGSYRVTLDPGASSIAWTLGATMHTVEGTFQLESGTVTFDPATGEVSGKVIVDATSGDSGKKGRDEDMHRKVLESEKYPRFVFTPSRVEGTFDPTTASEVTVHGSLEIHGDRHEISVPVTLAVNDSAFEATGSFVVPYVEWGMEDPSKFILRVDKEVEVTVRAEGTLKRSEPSPSAGEGETPSDDEGVGDGGAAPAP